MRAGPTGARCRPEWHERLAFQAAACAQAQPVLLSRLLVARAALPWVGVLIQVLLLLGWPDAWPAVRTWLVTLAAVAVLFALARSRTADWGLVAGTFGFGAAVDAGGRHVSLALAASTGLQTRDAGPIIAIAGLVE